MRSLPPCRGLEALVAQLVRTLKADRERAERLYEANRRADKLIVERCKRRLESMSNR